MARAKAYDSWEDFGMAFSTDEVEAYFPAKWAQGRIAVLCARRHVVMRHLELPDITKPLWWKHVAKVMRDRITWYAAAMPLLAVTPEELGEEGLPGRTTKAGKELSLAASLLEENKFVGEWGVDAEDAMRYVVTIGRRAAAVGNGHWTRETIKQNNRLANCVMMEIQATQKLDEQLASYT